MAEMLEQTSFKIEPFDPSIMEFRRWLHRLEGTFTAFKVTEELQYHYIGSKSFEILCDEVSPEDPYKKTSIELTEKMKQFYSPKPLEKAENFRFHQKKHQNGDFARICGFFTKVEYSL
ncbi:hypothetical protein JTB14_026633 [Gonioctena quinquepunctata]|nr:hypothetical protein JTB14_026633 [Gonioctena quinquepunctata]